MSEAFRTKRPHRDSERSTPWPAGRPRSDVRTALTRLNAVQHGLTADAPVIPGESLEEWLAFRVGIVDAWAPADAYEAFLAERIATLAWECRRVSRYEREAIAVAVDRVEADYAESRRHIPFNDAPLSLAEAGQRLDDARRCLAILVRLRDTPPVTPIAAEDVWGILGVLATNAEQDDDDYVDGIDEAAGAGPWTYGRFLAVLKALAARDGGEFADLLVDTVAEARRIVVGAELLFAEVDAELGRTRRERGIPSGPAFEAILRYGGAKNRQLYQAINQLEATQARRLGAPTPLARVQLYGLPGG